MSEETEDHSGAAESSPDDSGGAGQDQSRHDAEPQRAPRAGGRGVAWLALVLVVALAGAAAWLVLGPGAKWLPGVDTEQRDAVREQRLQALERRMEDLARQRLGEVESSISGLRSQLDGIGDNLETLRRELDAVPPPFDPQPLRRRLEDLSQRFDSEIPALRERLSTLESRLNAAVESDAPRRVRHRAALLDAIAYLREGRVRFEVARRAEPALGAFRQAMAILEDVNVSGLDPVRAALRAEVEQLSQAAADAPDASVAELGDLADAVGQWPLAGTAGRDAAAPAGDESGAGRTDGWRQRLTGLFGEMVRIRRAGEAPVTVDEARSVRRQVATQLATAQLMLLQRRHAAYRQTLDAVVATLEEWFDVDNSRVSAALSSLRALREQAGAREALRVGEAEDQLRELLQSLEGAAS